MKFQAFDDVDRKWSKWHGQRCPICREGMLTDGIRSKQGSHHDRSYVYTQTASWCGKCDEGLVISDPIQEVDIMEFLKLVQPAEAR